MHELRHPGEITQLTMQNLKLRREILPGAIDLGGVSKEMSVGVLRREGHVKDGKKVESRWNSRNPAHLTAG